MQETDEPIHTAYLPGYRVTTNSNDLKKAGLTGNESPSPRSSILDKNLQIYRKIVNASPTTKKSRSKINTDLEGLSSQAANPRSSINVVETIKDYVEYNSTGGRISKMSKDKDSVVSIKQ